MIETIGGFVGRVAIYITAGLGVVALYFLWVAFREWRAGGRTVFGVERDIAESEMVGAIVRAGFVVFIGVLVFGLGWLGRQQAESEDEKTQSPRAPTPTFPALATVGPETIESVATALPTEPPQPAVTDVPPLPPAPTGALPVEPTPQVAIVAASGGVNLRDAPNGGAIVVVPEGSAVELLEGREFAGDFDWQYVRIVSVPLGSDAQIDQEGWVAFQFLDVNP